MGPVEEKRNGQATSVQARARITVGAQRVAHGGGVSMTSLLVFTRIGAKSIQYHGVSVRDTNMPEPTELHVVAEAQQGDPVALTALYEHFKQDVFRFILFRTNDTEVAADLTGDVFEKMIKALPTYQPQRPFAAWLFQIARNHVIDYWRKQKVRQSVPLDERMPSTDDSPDEMVEKKLTLERLVGALSHLTDDQQEVVILRYGLGMRIRAVATIMGKSEGSVRMLQHRALQALRNRLYRGEEEL